MEVRLLIKKRAVKRRGGMMADALVAMIIVALVIIPVSAAIAFVYSSIVGSAEISVQINKFYDKVDALILAKMFDESLSLGQVPVPPPSPIRIYGNNGTGPINANLRWIREDLQAGGSGGSRWREAKVKVYMIQR